MRMQLDEGLTGKEALDGGPEPGLLLFSLPGLPSPLLPLSPVGLRVGPVASARGRTGAAIDRHIRFLVLVNGRDRILGLADRGDRILVTVVTAPLSVLVLGVMILAFLIVARFPLIFRPAQSAGAGRCAGALAFGRCLGVLGSKVRLDDALAVLDVKEFLAGCRRRCFVLRVNALAAVATGPAVVVRGAFTVLAPVLRPG